MKKKLIVLIEMVLLLAIYFVFAQSYAKGIICNNRNSFLGISIIFGGLGVIVCYKRQIHDRLPIPHRLKYIFFGVNPIISFCVGEMSYNVAFKEIDIDKVLVNYFILLGLQVGLLLIVNNYRWTFTIILLFQWICGIANYYVLLFKGNPLMPSDLMSVKTAMSVVANYTFELSDSIVFATVLCVLWFIIIEVFLFEDGKKSEKKWFIFAGAGVLELIAFIVLLLHINWVGYFDIVIDAWSPRNSYFQNGYLFTFVREVQIMLPQKPHGYSKQSAENLLDDYNEINDVEMHDEAEAPTVVVIMNEAFSDLSVLGEFEYDNCFTNISDELSFVQSGNTYVSIVGGGTCNSEFEFLTGNSMSNIGGNVYPYQMYDLSNVPNLAGIFRDNGYDTIAIHPAEARNWNRDSVYEQLGFQQFVSIESMTNVDKIRLYASDEYSYEKIIEAYENSNGPAFIFNVTMQNHGGYSDNLDELAAIDIEGRFNQYKDVITYLTLIKESDRAFAKLVDYFAKVEEPVIVCIFGDHQPMISDDFVKEIQGENEELYQKQRRYITPYYIWTNYDIEGKDNEIIDMSLNYLGANILKMTGISEPYFEFLLDLQKKVPIVNKLGYKTDSGEWFQLNQPHEMLDKYRMIQYYNLFDTVKDVK